MEVQDPIKVSIFLWFIHKSLNISIMLVKDVMYPTVVNVFKEMLTYVLNVEVVMI